MAEQPRYLTFSRAEWRALRGGAALTVSEAEIEQVRSLNDRLSLDEVSDVYLPLARLLSLHAEAARRLSAVRDAFLGRPGGAVPYVIGIAGSVAVGKSTTARVLQILLSRWPGHPRVELVTTDGFLLSNQALEARGLLDRKGFPESYDQRALLLFLERLKAGDQNLTAPVYSHLEYDVLPTPRPLLDRPDIVILEGLNILQTRGEAGRHPPRFVSDFFDFSIYVDADPAHIALWYVERFSRLRRTAFADPRSYFHAYAGLSDDEALAVATQKWRTINEVNLRENIAPTRARARLILNKGADHLVQSVLLGRF